MKQNQIIIFTDGSSLGNPGRGGWGAIVAHTDGRIAELGGRENMTTNNRMELQGAIGALLEIKHNEGDVVIHTDSRYVIQGITKWVHAWIKNGWITSTKAEVINRDLWEILTALVYERELKNKIVWQYIPGHSGIPGNERVDEIATGFSEGKEVKLFTGTTAEYSINLSELKADSAKKETKDNKKSRSNLKAYSYVSAVDGKVEIHKTWAECEKRVKGVGGAKFKKSLSKEDEEKLVSEWSK